jgi:uncharacterized protein YcbX
MPPSPVRVSSLRRYPVKSLGGEVVAELAFGERGGEKDRVFALYDADGKIGSGKTTRRFRRMPGLLMLEASSRDAGFDVRFPAGTATAGPGPALDAALSAYLGTEVWCRAESAVQHHDDAPVHLVSTASLEALGAAIGPHAAEVRRFRPNVVVEAADRVEEEWIGRRVACGPDVILEVVARTQRCVMVTLAQPGVAEAPDVLRHLAGESDACFGVYARVVRSGVVRRGDEVVPM